MNRGYFFKALYKICLNSTACPMPGNLRKLRLSKWKLRLKAEHTWLRRTKWKGLRAMRESDRSTFGGKGFIFKSLCSNIFCSYVLLLSSELGISWRSWGCPTSSRKFLTWDEWFHQSRGVRPALAVDGSWLKPGDTVGLCFGCTGGACDASKGWNFAVNRTEGA